MDYEDYERLKAILTDAGYETDFVDWLLSHGYTLDEIERKYVWHEDWDYVC